MTRLKLFCVATLGTLLSGCSGFFDKDNTPLPSPLVSVKQEFPVHAIYHASATSGVGSEYLKLVPAITERAIYTASKDGDISANDKLTGRTLWKKSLRHSITSGPAANTNIVVVGGRNGEIIALQTSDGREAWRAGVTSEILAPPAISQNIVIIKSIDGRLTALAAGDGRPLWNYQQIEPSLILRGASAPQIKEDNLVAGFANGNLARLTLHGGNLQWDQMIALPEGSFAIQRMIDVDADPIIFKDRIYAATYQGKIAALDLRTGKSLWNYDISSYSGMGADTKQVYVSDAKGQVWAFDAESGRVDWQQSHLKARNITGPALYDRYIVVGDEEGYLHWLSKQDGHFVARTRVDSSGILATPVIENNVLYVLTKNGRLTAYKIG